MGKTRVVEGWGVEGCGVGVANALSEGRAPVSKIRRLKGQGDFMAL
jgi:hypothetical protein